MPGRVCSMSRRTVVSLAAGIYWQGGDVNDVVLDVPDHLQRTWYGKEDVSQEAARAAHALVCDVAGVDDLGQRAVLEYCCGSRMSRYLLENDLPVKRYVGVDTNAGLIGYLRSTVQDARFDYFHADIYHETHNPEGSELADLDALPVGDQVFDLIFLFSAFMHLAPHDYKQLLRLLGAHASDNARLLYSVYLNERTPGGHGQMDRWGPLIEEQGDIAPGTLVPDFCDFFPDRPLQAVFYSRAYALALVEDTGWRVEEVRDPTPHLQHVIVCAPERYIAPVQG